MDFDDYYARRLITEFSHAGGQLSAIRASAFQDEMEKHEGDLEERFRNAFMFPDWQNVDTPRLALAWVIVVSPALDPADRQAIGRVLYG